MSKIILRNSTIPATGSEMFTTAVDNQTAVDIHVLQGERELVADNRSLARFKLRGIPPMPAGMPRVQVQFQIDANGILSVTAAELRTEVEQTIEVKPSYGSPTTRSSACCSSRSSMRKPTSRRGC